MYFVVERTQYGFFSHHSDENEFELCFGMKATALLFDVYKMCVLKKNEKIMREITEKCYRNKNLFMKLIFLLKLDREMNRY